MHLEELEKPRSKKTKLPNFRTTRFAVSVPFHPLTLGPPEDELPWVPYLAGKHVTSLAWVFFNLVPRAIREPDKWPRCRLQNVQDSCTFLRLVSWEGSTWVSWDFSQYGGGTASSILCACRQCPHFEAVCLVKDVRGVLASSCVLMVGAHGNSLGRFATKLTIVQPAPRVICRA